MKTNKMIETLKRMCENQTNTIDHQISRIGDLERRCYALEKDAESSLTRALVAEKTVETLVLGVKWLPVNSEGGKAYGR